MPFTDTQIKDLKAKLSAKHVKTREEAGRTLSYVEGWHAIAEANRIFGFDAWDRETTAANCVWEGMRNGLNVCSYIARVRVRVRAGETAVIREGSGSGHGTGLTPGEAHENALKKAETDAMKRALATFGNPFGLALYDKEQQGVRHYSSRKAAQRTAQPVSWAVRSASGETLSKHADPVEFCSGLRRQLENIESADELIAFWSKNQEIVAQLRRALPDLKTERGQHYGELLGTLYTKRLQEFAAKKTAQAEKDHVGAAGLENGTKETKLPEAKPRRVRDKEHLRFVANLPCLICGRSPGQAHHIRYAQPRALSRKVSDEWAVPLCALHHRALHDHGNEEAWWKQHRIDPMSEAERLWQETRGVQRAKEPQESRVKPRVAC